MSLQVFPYDLSGDATSCCSYPAIENDFESAEACMYFSQKVLFYIQCKKRVKIYFIGEVCI